MAVTSMNTKGPKKKKQHYVPKFYLRGFCGSGDTVFALDKESGGNIYTLGWRFLCGEVPVRIPIERPQLVQGEIRLSELH